MQLLISNTFRLFTNLKKIEHLKLEKIQNSCVAVQFHLKLV